MWKELQQFLGLCNYYRRFIADFSTIAEPLYQLLRNNVEFLWNSTCDESVCKLKQTLIKAPILGYPTSGGHYTLHTDASGQGIAAILSQTQSERQVNICYLSRTLSPAERNYSTSEKECLAIVWAIKSLRHYLLGTKFTVISDHSCLQWLKNQKDPYGRLNRWSLTLQNYDFEVKHAPGTSVPHVDALSRLLFIKNTELNMKDEQERDPDLQTIRNILLKKSGTETQNAPSDIFNYIIENDILYHLWWPRSTKKSKITSKRLAIPKHLVLQVFRSCHDDPSGGHFAMEKTYEKVRDRFYWPNIYGECKDYISKCLVCAKHNQTSLNHNYGKLEPIVVSRPFEVVGVDILGSLSRTSLGNKYIIFYGPFY